VLINLESSRDEPPEMSVEELPVSATFTGPSGTVVLAGSDAITIEVLGRSFRVSAPSFFQVNLEIAARMVAHILEQLPHQGNMTLVELYSGVGLFSAFLAPRVKRLVAVESSPAACEDFVENLDEFENVELYEGSVEDILPHLNVHPNCVLADPPRGGLGPKVVQEIIKMNPVWIGYISCDPSTLSRDARRLVEAGYQLAQVTPFDMFPQTFHIESISIWKRN
jgi:23S rRNA (uracil1939-C5)-methyltransferase